MDGSVTRLIDTAIRRYAEARPRPVHVTRKQAAEMLGVSARTITRLIAAKQIKTNKFGLIPIGEIDRALAGDG